MFEQVFFRAYNLSNEKQKCLSYCKRKKGAGNIDQELILHIWMESSTIRRCALVAQWIERRPPEPKIVVRFHAGAYERSEYSPERVNCFTRGVESKGTVMFCEHAKQTSRGREAVRAAASTELVTDSTQAHLIILYRCDIIGLPCALSSVGRAALLHSEGRGFKSLSAHKILSPKVLLWDF